MRVLLIDKDVDTGRYLRQGLSESGYAVEWIRDRNEGLDRLSANAFDLVIMDISFPTKRCWLQLHTLKNISTAPVIALGKHGGIEHKVQALNTGADDYLTKPPIFIELLARMSSLTRRITPKENTILIVDDLLIDLVNRRILRSGNRIELTIKEFMLLTLLARQTGKAISRTAIASHVWNMNFSSNTNLVEVTMSRLRAKIDAPYQNKLIHTVRGIGYMLESQADARR